MRKAQEATIVWFRRDLRIDDQPALVEAAARGGILPVFIMDSLSSLGAAARVSLYGALQGLEADLLARGAKLWLGCGDPCVILPRLAQACGIKRIFCTDLYDPAEAPRTSALREALQEKGIEIQIFPGSFAFPPGSLMTAEGQPYKVFTPFYKAALASPVATPLSAPRQLQGIDAFMEGVSLEALDLLPRGPDWSGAFAPVRASTEILDAFVRKGLKSYAKDRDYPARAGTSRLSVALHWGQISPAQIFAALQAAQARDPTLGTGVAAFWREILWRAFAAQLLFHFPYTENKPFQTGFAAFPWAEDTAGLERWQKGQTGFPIIDAGMRELWETGYMHGRVRMIVASFLCKDLLIPWQTGAAWFDETLMDADRANNLFGWQWTAGCGADAAPYFRVFNPLRQALTFDPNGDYVRRYVPELAALPGASIHAPALQDTAALTRAGVQMGQDYPWPMLDHGKARARALAAYALVKGKKRGTQD